MAPFIVDFFRRLEQGNSKTREILATKSREILILIDIPLAEGTLTESVDARCALGAVSCPTGAVCLCAYISKPVVTAPPRHYLSHASAPIFIGEVIHEASSSSPLLPYPPWAHNSARFHGNQGERERKGYSIRILRSKLSERLFYRVQYVPSPSFFSYR